MRLLFFRGYLESFSTISKSPRTPVNTISKSKEKAESNSYKLNEPESNDNHVQLKEPYTETINQV